MPREDTQFKPGNPGGPGRPRGSKNRLSEDFLKDLQTVWAEPVKNEDGKQSRAGIEAMRTMCRNHPSEFVRVCAGLVPKELLLEINKPEETKFVINARPQQDAETWLEESRRILEAHSATNDQGSTPSKG